MAIEFFTAGTKAAIGFLKNSPDIKFWKIPGMIKNTLERTPEADVLIKTAEGITNKEAGIFIPTDKIPLLQSWKNRWMEAIRSFLTHRGWFNFKFEKQTIGEAVQQTVKSGDEAKTTTTAVKAAVENGAPAVVSETAEAGAKTVTADAGETIAKAAVTEGGETTAKAVAGETPGAATPVTEGAETGAKAAAEELETTSAQVASVADQIPYRIRQQGGDVKVALNNDQLFVGTRSHGNRTWGDDAVVHLKKQTPAGKLLNSLANVNWESRPLILSNEELKAAHDLLKTSKLAGQQVKQVISVKHDEILAELADGRLLQLYKRSGSQDFASKLGATPLNTGKNDTMAFVIHKKPDTVEVTKDNLKQMSELLKQKGFVQTGWFLDNIDLIFVNGKPALLRAPGFKHMDEIYGAPKWTTTLNRVGADGAEQNIPITIREKAEDLSRLSYTLADANNNVLGEFTYYPGKKHVSIDTLNSKGQFAAIPDDMMDVIHNILKTNKHFSGKSIVIHPGSANVSPATLYKHGYRVAGKNPAKVAEANQMITEIMEKYPSANIDNFATFYKRFIKYTDLDDDAFTSMFNTMVMDPAKKGGIATHLKNTPQLTALSGADAA